MFAVEISQSRHLFPRFPPENSRILSPALLISRDNSLVAPQKWHEKCVCALEPRGISMKSMNGMGWALPER